MMEIKYKRYILPFIFIALLMPILGIASSTNNLKSAILFTSALSELFNNTFTGSYTFALIAAMIVFLIAAFVYMLSNVIGSHNGLNWAKTQIYQALIGIIILLVFIWLTPLLLSNPSGALNSAGILPSTCRSSNVNTLFNTSACDLSTFTTSATTLMQTIYYLTYVEALIPGVGIAPNIPSDVFNVGFKSEVSSIAPKSIDDMTSVVLEALILGLLLNQVQMLIISAAPLLLSLFISIGVIAWIFGISRSFGGTMIALGVGLGIIYPLLVTITYGFISTGLLATLNNPTNLQGMLNAFGNMVLNVSIALFNLITIWSTNNFAANTGANLQAITISASQAYQSAMGEIYLLLEAMGFVFAGLTFIPFLNFTILDSFVMDFSKAIGERVSFMDLIAGLV